MLVQCNKFFGNGMLFAWAPDSNTYAVLEMAAMVHEFWVPDLLIICEGSKVGCCIPHSILKLLAAIHPLFSLGSGMNSIHLPAGGWHLMGL